MTPPIPRLYCPIPDLVHDRALDLNVSTMAWVQRLGLYRDEEQYKRLVRLQPGLLAARVVPDGDFAAMGVFVDFHTWLFALDDAYCDEGELGRKPGELATLFAKLVRAAEVPSVPILAGNPFSESLRDIRTRLGACATDVQIGRWVEAVRTYLSHQIWEAANRVQGVVPTLEEYALMRIHNGAMKSSIMLLDVAGAYEVPAAEMETAEVRALVEMCATLVGWDNDIYSHRKETLRCGDGQNLLDVLVRENMYSLHEAMADAASMRDRIMVQFLRLRALVLDGGSEPVRRFVGSLGSWVRANLEFSRTSDRYVGVDGMDEVERACTDSRPDALAEGPVPITPFEWWWSAGK